MIEERINRTKAFYLTDLPLMKFIEKHHLIQKVTRRRVSREYLRRYAAEHSKRYLQRMEFVVKLSRSAGFRPLFILQPSGAFLRHDQGCLGDVDKPVVLRKSEKRYYYQELYKEIMAGAANRELKGYLYDLSQIFDNEQCGKKDGPSFIDWQHLTKTGDAVVAEKIRMILEQQPGGADTGGE